MTAGWPEDWEDRVLGGACWAVPAGWRCSYSLVGEFTAALVRGEFRRRAAGRG